MLYTSLLMILTVALKKMTGLTHYLNRSGDKLFSYLQ